MSAGVQLNDCLEVGELVTSCGVCLGPFAAISAYDIIAKELTKVGRRIKDSDTVGICRARSRSIAQLVEKDPMICGWLVLTMRVSCLDFRVTMMAIERMDQSLGPRK